MTMELRRQERRTSSFDDAPDRSRRSRNCIINGIFFNQGHVCCAGSRLLVHEPVAAEVLAKLKNRIKVMRVGDPLDKNTDVGAINSKEQLGKITELVASGVEEGAEMFQSPCKLPTKGWYFRPTVFSKVTMSHRIAREEVFGPVLSVLTFRTAWTRRCVEKANNTAYGLSAGVWTDKGSAHPENVDGAEGRRGAGPTPTTNSTRTSPFRWLQGKRLRPRGRPAGPARLLQARLSFGQNEQNLSRSRRNPEALRNRNPIPFIRKDSYPNHELLPAYLTAPIKTDQMPPGIPYIVGNEAAERFNFYGMRAILTVYMTKYLLDRSGALAPMTDNDANKWYHLFLSANYFFPTFGAIISDAFWGKYNMIIRLSLVYCLGSVVLALDHTRLGLTLGLTLIAIGAGGIKPCVSSHVGDQFGSLNQPLLSRAFGWFYFSVNFGSFFSILLIPKLLKYYGPLPAFGVPAVLMLLAAYVFWMGRHKFAHIPPGGKTFRSTRHLQPRGSFAALVR